MIRCPRKTCWKKLNGMSRGLSQPTSWVFSALGPTRRTCFVSTCCCIHVIARANGEKTSSCKPLHKPVRFACDNKILGQQRQRTCSSFRVCQSSPGPSFLPSLLYSLTALLRPPHHCLVVLLQRIQMFTVLSSQSLRLRADYTTSCIYNIV